MKHRTDTLEVRTTTGRRLLLGKVNGDICIADCQVEVIEGKEMHTNRLYFLELEVAVWLAGAIVEMSQPGYPNHLEHKGYSRMLEERSND